MFGNGLTVNFELGVPGFHRAVTFTEPSSCVISSAPLSSQTFKPWLSSSLPRLLAVMIHLYDPAFRCSVFLILNPVAFVFGDLKNKK